MPNAIWSDGLAASVEPLSVKGPEKASRAHAEVELWVDAYTTDTAGSVRGALVQIVYQPSCFVEVVFNDTDVQRDYHK